MSGTVLSASRLSFALHFAEHHFHLPSGSYKSCGEIQDAKVNSSTSYSITIDGKSVQVSCNMTSQPAETIIPLQHVIHVKTGDKGYNVGYAAGGSLSANHIRKFIKQSEICKQQVSYRCSNSTPLVDKHFPLLHWTSIESSPRYYWPGCSLSDKTCRCDPETSMTKDDYTYLTKKKDLPLTSLQFGALPSGSNISVTVGDIVCKGGWYDKLYICMVQLLLPTQFLSGT